MALTDFTCPRCGDFFRRCYPALSRVDNETNICSACGEEEAWEAYRYGLVARKWTPETSGD